MTYFNLFDHNRPDLCISPSAIIGENVSLGSGVVIDDNAIIGDGCRIWHHTVIRSNATLGNNVVIGHNCVIEKGASIGSETTIQSQSNITAFADIGRRVFIGSMVVLVNEKRIASHGRKIPQKLVGPIVKDGARVGALSLLMPGSVVGEEAALGAGSILKGTIEDKTYHVCRPTEVVTFPVPEEELLP